MVRDVLFVVGSANPCLDAGEERSLVDTSINNMIINVNLRRENGRTHPHRRVLESYVSERDTRVCSEVHLSESNNVQTNRQ